MINDIEYNILKYVYKIGKIKQSEIIEILSYDYSIFEIIPYIQKLRTYGYLEYDNSGYISITDTGVRIYENQKMDT